MKTCFKCQKTKPLTEFYRHKQMQDGHLNKCKECTRNDVREHRSANIDKVREYDRKRGSLPHRILARAEYAKTENGKKALQRGKATWQARNPKKRLAHVILGNAVRDGRKKKPSRCTLCGAGGKIHGHHEDYSKPLDVTWVCHRCHSGIHKHTNKKGNEI